MLWNTRLHTNKIGIQNSFRCICAFHIKIHVFFLSVGWFVRFVFFSLFRSNNLRIYVIQMILSWLRVEVSSYTKQHLYMQNRSFSRDILRVLFCLYPPHCDTLELERWWYVVPLKLIFHISTMRLSQNFSTNTPLLSCGTLSLSERFGTASSRINIQHSTQRDMSTFLVAPTI